ncbi:hypothetical protein LIER_28213 [Lithospermum erythrorhizon]|uniref:Uncharacterized protein n=1 Tax=Lithospermum erythrorhizon TaxID=34254 RepID=A0AAV3RIS6_LITER
MGEEEGLRTVESLRGRLLAERLASRNAKEVADQTENKLVELEALLKEEIKSRKKAEKRLKLLMKRLQSLKISNPSYVFDESDQSCSFDTSEVTSVSSSASSTSKKTEEKKVITQQTVGSISSDTQDLIKNIKLSSVVSENYKQDVSLSRISSFSKGNESIGDEETFSSFGEANSNGSSRESKVDDQSLNSSNEEHKNNGEDNEGIDNVDCSMALVPVDFPKTAELARDVVVHAASVKEALDSLQQIKEKIQISMEQRRIVRVG